jgi:dihydrodiol dehydrogenase / D-xylose 1-dehydrogenase (NADP)
MTDTIRWGILGTGAIAKKFAEGLSVLPDAELVAVGSRTQDSADTFGDAYQVSHRHPGYAALASDPDVDVIYIGTPHSLHCENTIMCLEAGKAVLCEKPFAINASQARDMIALAREMGLFLMEAMWSRFLPIIVQVRGLLADGAIGDLRMLSADFGFRADVDPKSRLFDPHLGGGALLDVGIYPISLASMLLGPPTRITSMAHLGETSVDEQAAIIFGYGEGQLAILSTAIRTDSPIEAILLGTKGCVRIHSPWYHGTALTLSVTDHEDVVMRLPYKGNGYTHEAIEVARCLRDGKLESDTMSLDETLSIMETMDTIRAQWGLSYPME